MALMMAMILFDYSVLRALKDSFVVKHPMMGVETIGFLKSWFVLPSAALLMTLYVKLSNSLRRATLFYVTVGSFLVYFFLFNFVLLPNAELIQPSKSWVLSLQAEYPRLKPMIGIMAQWTLSSFYVMAELWGSFCLSLAFWQFANYITKVSEAKRFYALFGFLANFGLMGAGVIIKWVTGMTEGMAYADKFRFAINWCSILVLIAGVVALCCYYYIDKRVLTNKNLFDPSQVKKKSKVKLSVKDSLKLIVSSPFKINCCLGHLLWCVN